MKGIKIVKAFEMGEVDKRAIEELGIPSLLLMEKAGLSVVETIRREFPKAKRVLVLVGKGNNGGDGLVCARHLYLLGYQVDYYLAFGEDLRGDALLQYRILKNLGLEPIKRVDFSSYELVVDALFGTGFNPPVRGEVADLIRALNGSGVGVVSVDIPSGLSADSPVEYEPSVKAHATVTFQFPKVCHLLHPSAKRCGKLYVANIGIPPWLAKEVKRELLLSVDVPKREQDVHKGKMGHVLLVGASVGKVGALVLSAKASTRAGAGLVSVAFPKGLYSVVESLLVEEMTIPVEKEERISYEGAKKLIELQDRFSAVGVGMGMDRYEEGQRVIKELLLNLEKPLLLDADALNNLADLGVELLKRRKHPTILTPHVGEFQRLSGLDKEKIIARFLECAQEFAQEHACYLVLKSSRTAIALPDGRVFLSTRGTPAMAKGGVGDVLAGILTALVSRGLPIEHALSLGVFLHGVAGEVAHKQSHAESLRALDLVECLPTAYNLLENEAVEPAFTYIP